MHLSTCHTQQKMANISNFPAFFHGWHHHHQTLVDELVSVQNKPLDEEALSHLIERVLSHYNQYYQEKSRAANRNPFPFFSPPWLTPFERALLWVSGFKAMIIFKLVETSVWDDLTLEQKVRVEEEKQDTRRRERELTEEMARVQESVAAPPIYALMREDQRLIDGEVDELGEAMEELKGALRSVMEEADAVLGSTVRNVLEILSSMQRIKFLVAAGQYVVQIRRWGLMLGSRGST